MYTQNLQAANTDSSEEYRIPRIIHQIWLGSQVPEQYRNWMESWTSLEGWEYRLWTDREVAELHLHNRELYDNSHNFGEKSDILRLEILQQFGGVYADIDYECLQPQMFEELHKKFDFYIGFEPLSMGSCRKFRIFKTCNAILAAAPHHPLLHDLITNMKANYYAYIHFGVVERTGPSYLTRIICQHEMTGAHAKRNAYLPSSFFYPVSYRDRMNYQHHSKRILQLFPEAAGVHFWEGSWRPTRSDYNTDLNCNEELYP
jgi:mannosyltransferase OCH1-like enzyme